MTQHTFHVDPRNASDERDELTIQIQFRGQMRMIAPSVMLVGVPNAGKRSAWERRQRGKEGLTPGFPDMIALYNGEALFLEFKKGDGSLSTVQVEVLNRLTQLGFKVGVFRRPDTATEWMQAHWPDAFIGRLAA